MVEMKCPKCDKKMESTVLGDLFWCPNRKCDQSVVIVNNFDYRNAFFDQRRLGAAR